MFKVAQESSAEALKSSENNPRLKNVHIHKTGEQSMTIIDFPNKSVCFSPKASDRESAQPEVTDVEASLRKSDLEGSLRSKKNKSIDQKPTVTVLHV